MYNFLTSTINKEINLMKKKKEFLLGNQYRKELYKNNISN